MSALDLLSMFDGHVAVVGRTGSGKTYAARGAVERMLDDGRRVCVIDPTGAWWGLRSSADGKDPGFPVIVFGGDHADVPVFDDQGEAIGSLVAERALNCVIDLSHFGVGEMRRFMTGFMGALYQHLRAPLHLVVDEADEFAPQRIPPEGTTLFNRLDRIVRRGRSRGFRVTMITQRPAVLNKDVLSQAATLIAMKLVGPQDRKAIGGWIEGQADAAAGKEVLASLPTLATGEGWVWCPEQEVLQRMKFPLIATFDSGRTPQHGEKIARPLLAEIDVDSITEMLRSTGQKEIGDLPTSEKRRCTAAERQEAHDRGFASGRAEGLAEGKAAARRAIERVLTELGQDLPPVEIVQPSKPRTAEQKPPAPKPKTETGGALHSAAAKILAVLAQTSPARWTWSQAAVLAGIKARGGHFNAGRQQLRAEGYIEEQSDLITASPKGIDAAGEVPAAPSTPAECLAMWSSKLASPVPEMLAYLEKEYPSRVTRDAMAAALGKQPRGGHWNGGIAALRNNGLIEESATGMRLAAFLMEGRAS